MKKKGKTENIVVQKKLKQWVEEMQTANRLTMRELADRANLPHSSIARALNPNERVGVKVATALARAFGVPLENVLEMAELIPIKPESTNDSRLLLYIYERLDPDNRHALIEFAKHLQGRNTPPTPQV